MILEHAISLSEEFLSWEIVFDVKSYDRNMPNLCSHLCQMVNESLTLTSLGWTRRCSCAVGGESAGRSTQWMSIKWTLERQSWWPSAPMVKSTAHSHRSTQIAECFACFYHHLRENWQKRTGIGETTLSYCATVPATKPVVSRWLIWKRLASEHVSQLPTLTQLLQLSMLLVSWNQSIWIRND